ncbi:CD109 family protein [Megaselia abdita]
MFPSVNVHLLLEQDGDLIESNIKICFQVLRNQIEIVACEESQPGKEVDLTIKTSADSHVGLLCVDQSVGLLKTNESFDLQKITRSCETFEILTISNIPYYKTCDEWDLDVPRSHGRSRSRSRSRCSVSNERESQEPLPEIRKEFPETWIWEDIIVSSPETTIRRKAPDTITSWTLTGFSLSETLGLAITEKAKTLKIFKPFFVSLSLPYSIKSGEIVTIPVILFNYLEENLLVDVSLESSSDFDFVGGEAQTKSIIAPADDSQKVTFKIKATTVRVITLIVKAASPIYKDIIHQTLKVEPEGITEYVNRSFLINLTDQPYFKETIKIAIPENAVPDSEKVELSVVGDILGTTIQNLDNLVRIPYGCGEQNMINFVPNILILQYLTVTNQLTEAIEKKAKSFTEIGYGRQLHYKHNDGSYSAFGQDSCQRFGSTWLTAYVVRSFQEAKPFTFIDEKILTESLDFLVYKQVRSGRFVENGVLFDFKHDSGEDKGIALTAFVLLAFLQVREISAVYSEPISKGLQFLVDNILSIESLYAQAIGTYALSLARHQFATKAFEHLKQKMTIIDGLAFWSTSEDSSTKTSVNNVEITSYALLAFIEQGKIDEVIPIVKWLISQRNSNGGFDSTQNTVLGLQALTKFAIKTKANGFCKIDIMFKNDKGVNGYFKVNQDNALVLQHNALPRNTKTINVNVEGKGSCLLQASYSYNMSIKDGVSLFNIEAFRKETDEEWLNLIVVSSYSGGQSNMSILEVSLPSGCVADEKSFEDILENERVQMVESKNSGNVVVVYFDYLNNNSVEVSIRATKAINVDKLKKPAIVLYDYYDRSKIVKYFYEA